MEKKVTTLKLSTETKARLDKLKEHEAESYDLVINKALNILNICVKNPDVAAKILMDIEKSKKRTEMIKRGSAIQPQNNKLKQK